MKKYLLLAFLVFGLQASVYAGPACGKFYNKKWESGKAVIKGTKDGSLIDGEVFFEESREGLHVKAEIHNAPPGLHGFHIHEFGDLSNGCESAGAHYNPDGVEHGSLEQGHVGDLGNIIADKSGTARFQIKANRVTLSEVVGRAIVIHADEDDLGRGGDEESLKTGNAGQASVLQYSLHPPGLEIRLNQDRPSQSESQMMPLLFVQTTKQRRKAPLYFPLIGVHQDQSHRLS